MVTQRTFDTDLPAGSVSEILLREIPSLDPYPSRYNLRVMNALRKHIPEGPIIPYSPLWGRLSHKHPNREETIRNMACKISMVTSYYMECTFIIGEPFIHYVEELLGLPPTKKIPLRRYDTEKKVTLDTYACFPDYDIVWGADVLGLRLPLTSEYVQAKTNWRDECDLKEPEYLSGMLRGVVTEKVNRRGNIKRTIHLPEYAEVTPIIEKIDAFALDFYRLTKPKLKKNPNLRLSEAEKYILTAVEEWKALPRKERKDYYVVAKPVFTAKFFNAEKVLKEAGYENFEFPYLWAYENLIFISSYFDERTVSV